MINHARTLLMNVDGTSQAPEGCPGEELVDPGFKALPLPTYLQQFRSILFGTSPDRAMLNYRCAQLLGMIHSTELVEFVVELDRRITYPSASDLVGDAAFSFQQQVMSGDVEIAAQGNPQAPDVAGKVFHDFQVGFEGDQIVVTEYTPTPQMRFWSPTFTAGLSDAVPLGDSGYSVLVPANGGSWRAWCYNRPQWDPGQFVPELKEIGEPNLLSLFGVQPSGIYQTFNNLWTQNPYLPYCLGGLIMAVVYRTEEIRTGVPIV